MYIFINIYICIYIHIAFHSFSFLLVIMCVVDHFSTWLKAEDRPCHLYSPMPAGRYASSSMSFCILFVGLFCVGIMGRPLHGNPAISSSMLVRANVPTQKLLELAANKSGLVGAEALRKRVRQALYAPSDVRTPFGSVCKTATMEKGNKRVTFDYCCPFAFLYAA